MLTCQKRIVFLIWIGSILFFKDGDAITGQRLYKYTEDPLVEQVVIYPWLSPVYQTSYQPPSLRDDYGEARPHGDRSRLFWTRLLNGFRKGKPYTLNQTTNGQTSSGMATGIELANNFAIALGEEGMKRLAALVAAYLPLRPAGPPGSSWQYAPEGPLGSKGDNGQLGGSFPAPPDISQWTKGQKGEKGERGDCGCNELPTTLGPTTTIGTTVSTPEAPTSWPSTNTEGPTDWPSTSTEGPVVTTTTPITEVTTLTTDVQTTPDASTTTSPVVTTDEPFGTTPESTTLEATTATEGPTTPTDSITEGFTTEEISTTVAGSTTEGFTTDVSTTSTDGSETTTDWPTDAPITTTEGQTTTVDEATRPTNEQTTSTDLITDGTTNIPTTTNVWPTISTDFSASTTEEILTTGEGQTTTNEITTIPTITSTPAVTTTTDFPPVTEPIVADCRESIHHRNATWQSPESFDPEWTSNACVLSIQLNSADDANVQHEPICQIRLDFLEFFIAQPNRQSKCATDNFRVLNAENKVPILCGENSGQHLYLTPRSGTNGVQLSFKFGQSPISRFWKIDITLIPCCANHLLPPNDCLQYFNDFGGIVKSFNWMDSASIKRPSNHPRQLANQQYNICFKANSLAKSICYTPCPSAGSAFSISQNAIQGPFRAGVGVANCTEDFLLIANGYDRYDPSKRNDRFCGTIFNPDGNVTVSQGALIASASTTICSDIKPFQIHYTTNENELPADVANNGFCLQYEQEYLSKNQILLLDHDLPDDK